MSWWPFGNKDKPKADAAEEQVVHPSAVRKRSEPAQPKSPHMPAKQTPIPVVHHSAPEADEPIDEFDEEEEEPEVDDEGEEEVDDDEVAPFPKFEVSNKFVSLPSSASATELAISIGCATPDQMFASLENFFCEQQIPIADTEEVVEWLTENIDEIDCGWYWRPLRQCDVLNEARWGNDDYNSDEWHSRLYDLPIPTRVLERVKRIIDKFGSNVRFYISDFEEYDYESPGQGERADIFIIACPANFHPNPDDPDADFYYVFDTWRKPGYEDGK